MFANLTSRKQNLTIAAILVLVSVCGFAIFAHSPPWNSLPSLCLHVCACSQAISQLTDSSTCGSETVSPWVITQASVSACAACCTHSLVWIESSDLVFPSMASEFWISRFMISIVLDDLGGILGFLLLFL